MSVAQNGAARAGLVRRAEAPDEEALRAVVLAAGGWHAAAARSGSAVLDVPAALAAVVRGAVAEPDVPEARAGIPAQDGFGVRAEPAGPGDIRDAPEVRAAFRERAVFRGVLPAQAASQEPDAIQALSAAQVEFPERGVILDVLPVLDVGWPEPLLERDAQPARAVPGRHFADARCSP